MSIRIRNSFLITAPAGQAWTVLNDIERVASCVPGAQLIEIAGRSDWIRWLRAPGGKY